MRVPHCSVSLNLLNNCEELRKWMLHLVSLIPHTWLYRMIAKSIPQCFIRPKFIDFIWQNVLLTSFFHVKSSSSNCLFLSGRPIGKLKLNLAVHSDFTNWVWQIFLNLKLKPISLVFEEDVHGRAVVPSVTARWQCCRWLTQLSWFWLEFPVRRHTCHYQIVVEQIVKDRFFHQRY